MSKALKFHSRNQKAKIWKAWIDHGLNTPIYLRYTKKISVLAFKSLKLFILRRRAKKIREIKWR